MPAQFRDLFARDSVVNVRRAVGITQGQGGWSACARIVGLDGAPIAGLVTDVTVSKATEKLAP